MFLYRLKDDDYTLIRIDEDGANPEDCIEIYEGDFTELQTTSVGERQGEL